MSEVAQTSELNPENEKRRSDLIDKEIAGTISDVEKGELEVLQEDASTYHDRVASPRIAEAQRLLDELLSKKEQADRKKR